MPLVGIALADKRSEVDSSVGPAREEEAVAVLPGKLSVAVYLDPGRRAAIDFCKAIDGVEEVGWTIEGALMTGKKPAVVSANADVEDAAERIPGKLVVPFAVGVEGEQVAVLVERDVVVIAKAVRDDLALFAVR